MKMIKRTMILGLCLAVAMCSFSGCAKESDTTTVHSNKDIDLNHSAITDYTTDTITSITAENKFELDDEELIWNKPTYKINYCDLKIANAGFFSEGLCAFQDERTGFWGYMDTNFNVVIQPKFNNACAFNCGLAAVYDGDKWGFINKTGLYVIEPIYSNVYYKYNDDYIHSNAYKEGSMGFMGGYAVVDFDDTKEYVIDSIGNTVNVLDQGNMSEYGGTYEGTDIIYLSNLSSMSMGNTKFETISDNKFSEIRPLGWWSETVCCASKFVGAATFDGGYKEYIIDKYGNIVLNLEDFDKKYEYSIITNNSYTLQRKSSENTYHTALFDLSSNEIIPYYYTSILPLCAEGDAMYYIGYFNNDECELIDNNGKVLNYDWFDESKCTWAQICKVFGERSNEKFMFIVTDSSASLVNLTKNEVAFKITDISQIPSRSIRDNKKNFYADDDTMHTYIYNNYFLITDEFDMGYLYSIDGDFIREITTGYNPAGVNNDIVSLNLSEGIICDNIDNVHDIRTFLKLS